MMWMNEQYALKTGKMLEIVLQHFIGQEEKNREMLLLTVLQNLSKHM